MVVSCEDFEEQRNNKKRKRNKKQKLIHKISSGKLLTVFNSFKYDQYMKQCVSQLFVLNGNSRCTQKEKKKKNHSCLSRY